MRYSGSMVTLAVSGPEGADSALARAVYIGPGVNVVVLVSTPMAPRSSSSGCAVAAVEPEDGALLLPAAVAVWSSALAPLSPENSLALSDRALTDGWVTVMLSPATSAVVTAAEKTTVRTPEVPDPFVTSASWLYAFPLASAQLTAPAAGSIANVTMTVWPTGTPPAATVTASIVPAVLLPLVPTFLTNAIAARASERAGPTRSATARIVRAASWVVFRGGTPAILPPPPTGPTPGPGAGTHGSASRRSSCIGTSWMVLE